MKISNLFFIYFTLLLIGPLVYFGKFPFASYQIVFLVVLYFCFIPRVNSKGLYFPLYFKLYFLVLSVFLSTYAMSFFSPGYIASIRDFVIIYSPLQYVLVTTVLIKVIVLTGDVRGFTVRLLKLNTFLLTTVSIVAVLQIFDILGIQEFLAKYYGKSNVELWRQYFMYNPRASSTLNLEPNSLGLYCAVSLLAITIMRESIMLGRMNTVIAYILGLIGLLLSGSFTGVGIYCLGTVLFILYYKKLGFKSLLAILVVTSAMMGAFSEDIERSLSRQKISEDNFIPSSIKARVNNAWSKSYDEIADSPVYGIGPSAIQLDYSADNDFIDKYLRYGVVGGTAYLLFFLFLIFYPLLALKIDYPPILKRLFFLSFILALSYFLASITGSAIKAKRLGEFFWIMYSLPFIYIYYINNYSVAKEVN